MTHDVFGLLGTTIHDRYRVDEVVGEGGFGVVYKGFHLRLGHPIAVKCLKVPPHFTPEAKNLFYDKLCEEGEFLSRLSEHPSIVRVFDRGLTPCPFGGKVPYLVLEWLDGTELEATMLDARKRRRPPMSEADAVALLRPAVDAIALAHTMRIAHRDLKPANLYQAKTTRGLVLKVLDFGIARAMQEGETATLLATKTTRGFSAFSQPYGAPEQFFAKKFGATGPWTDVYALGLILSELVSGKAAYEGDEQAEHYEGAMAERCPTPRVKGARVSDGFEALVAKALARMPKERFQDAGEMLAAMDAVGKGTPETELHPQGKINARTIAVVAGVAVFGVVAAGLVVRSSLRRQEPSAETTVATTTSEAPATSDVGERHASPPATSSGFVKLQPGTFMMGSPTSEKGRSPVEDQHRVTITRAFEMKETEVTQGEWQEVMGSNPSSFKDCGASCPVEQVSWYDVIAYCNALSVKAGLERCYKDGAKDYDASSATSKTTPEWPKGLDCAGYRLPTEAEWEYAARAGTTSALYTGEVTSPEGADANVEKVAWYNKNSGSKTHAVKQKQGNVWGLYDMLGNVYEWTWDGYASHSGGEQRDPTGPATGTGRVFRGGSWGIDARNARSAFRVAGLPDRQFGYLGFRLARRQ